MKDSLSPRTVFAVILILLIFTGLSLFFVHYENVSEDEGIYLYAANQVYQGKWLYRDFIFPHLPTLPYFYGAVQKLFGRGIVNGRLTSCALYLINILLIGIICHKSFTPPTALLAMALLAFKNFNLVNLNLVFTYPLTIYFLLLALYFALNAGSRPTSYLWVTFFVLMAASARSLVIFTLPLFWAYLWRSRSRHVRIKELSYVLAAVGFFLVLLAPFILKSPGNFWFDVYEQYAMKRGASLGEFIVERKHYLAGTLTHYWPELLVTGVFGVLLFLRWQKEKKRFPADLRRYPQIVFLSSLVIMLLGATFLLPPFSYPLHNLVLAPILTMLIAWGLVTAYQDKRSGARLAAISCIVGMFVVFMSQNFLRVSYDLNKGYNSLKQIKNIARKIEKYTLPEEKLLTFSTYLALESNREVLSGLEQSGFACLFDQPEALCLQYKATSPQLLNTAIEQQKVGLVILSPAELINYQFSQLPPLVDSLSKFFFIAAKVKLPMSSENKLTIWLPNYKTSFAPLQDSADYWEEVADVLTKRGKLKRANILLDKTIETSPTALRYYKLAVNQFNADQPAKALQSLEEALKLAPDFKAATEKRDYLLKMLART